MKTNTQQIKSLNSDIIFNGLNYNSWKVLILAKLRAKEVGHAVFPGKSNSMTTPKENQKAIGLLTQSMEPRFAESVQEMETAEMIWTHLKSLYERVDDQEMSSLRRELYKLRCLEGEEVNLLMELEMYQRRLENGAAPVNDAELVIILTSALPKSWEQFTDGLRGSGIDMKCWTTIKGRILGEIAIRNSRREITKDEALNVNTHSNSAKSRRNPDSKKKVSKQKCYKCGDPGHIIKDCKEKLICFKCRKPGHIARNCDNAEEINNVDNKESLFYVDYIIDSGATTHIVKDLNHFWKKRSKLGGVKNADGSELRITMEGELKFDIDNKKINLGPVLYSKDVQRNILSMAVLMDNGIMISTKRNYLEIKIDDFETVVPRIGNFFIWKIEVAESINYIEESGELWHRRLGHIGYTALKNIQKEINDPKLILSKNDFKHCRECNLEKSTRRTFKMSTSIAENLLDLIHMDLCGPMSVDSIGKGKYMLLFVDDYSRMTHIRILKDKSSVFKEFKNFKMMVENELERRIKTIRTDGGGEFCSNDMEQFLISNGIKHEKSTPYTPQQNGRAERINRTIITMAKSMMAEFNSPKSFWAEAANAAVYIKNRLKHKAIVGKTPYELWYKKKPVYSNIRVFGCRAYVHIPKERRTKLDSTAKEMVFIGYSTTSKAWRFYDEENGKLCLSSEATFDERMVMDIRQNSKDSFDNEARDERDSDEESNQDSEKIKSIVEPIETNSDIEDAADDSREGLRRSTRSNLGIRTTHWSDPAARYWEEAACVFDEDSMDIILLTEEEDFKMNPDKWLEADREEYEQLLRNNTFELVDLPEGRKAIGSKIVRKLKLNPDGTINKRKSRIVAQGFSQKFGIDYKETFAPTLHFASLRLILILAAFMDLELIQLDIKGAFLYGDLKEEIYMRQPPGFASDNKVCKLKKSIYGLKQAGRVWNHKINAFLTRQGFKRLKSDTCIYVLKREQDLIIMGLYVDDQIISYNCHKLLENILVNLGKEFEYTRQPLTYILGLEIERDRSKKIIRINQRKYIKDMLVKFGMEDAKGTKLPMSPGLKLEVKGTNPDERYPYRELIGSLMYTATLTRPDIAFSIGYLSRFLKNFNEDCWITAKKILRYLKESIDVELILDGNKELRLNCFADADWGQDVNDRKSISGSIFLLGGTPIYWKSKKQQTVALSSTEAEYLSLSNCVTDGLWISTLMSELGLKEEILNVYLDNQGAIAIAKNLEGLGRAKHIDIKHHFIKDLVEKGLLSLEYVASEHQMADFLTKAVSLTKFLNVKERIGLTKYRSRGGVGIGSATNVDQWEKNKIVQRKHQSDSSANTGHLLD
jgi:hypothetical protein